MPIDTKRYRYLNDIKQATGDVVYWMSRDQRVEDNWALLVAQEKALETGHSVIVVFCLQPNYSIANLSHFEFMIEGLKEVENDLKKYNIPFVILEGEPAEVLPEFIKSYQIGCLVTDFSPLKIKTEWYTKLLPKLQIPLVEVDAHNIIPVWELSDKQEFAAYTIRPKVHKKIDQWLVEFPKLATQKPLQISSTISLEDLQTTTLSPFAIHQNYSFQSGSSHGKKTLDTFIKSKLNNYSQDRNDPNKTAISNLSPYLHFGHISAQRVALEIAKLSLAPFVKDRTENTQDYLEELVVRRELADNFCFYNPNYDSFDGFANWAKTTLKEHWEDRREYIYNLNSFETASTHDNLWNAAQKEMITTGKMHGFMRMYWAKKILEWTETPHQAMEFAIYLNDKYSLDGRDPNGYTGIAWSIGGIHDRAWNERSVFGKIRYMNYNGCKRKFDVDRYIESMLRSDERLF